MRSLIFYCVFFLTTCQLFGQSITGVDSLILLSFDSYSEHRYEEAIQLAQEALEKSEAKKDSARILKSQLYLLMAQQELNPATYDPKSIERIIPKLASRNLWKER
ncbi:MAG: hypothetical protein NXH89_14220, partial [Cyclobacteriaceae bacterium]|nr:hypothetical protein [Cyclobacteriaceae bacterium]